MLASSAVDRAFDPRAGQINDNKIGTCCISAKHTALRSISKDFVESESEWRVWVSTTDLFQWSSTIKIKNTTKIIGLQCRHHLIKIFLVLAIQVTMPKPYIKYKLISSSRSWDICYESFHYDKHEQF